MAHEAQTRLPWTAEEDAILISLVERFGEKRWNMVANGLPGRTGKGCSHRWRTYLRPDVKHPHLEPFTEWEAAVIIQAQKEMGNNWLAIAKLLLPGRSNTAVKNFWHCRLKSGSGTNVNRFIVEGYSLRYLLNEVPHEERIYPVALPAFPSTAPTGQLHPNQKHEQHMADLNQLAHNPAYMSGAAHDPLTAQTFPYNLEQDVANTDGNLMGLDPAAAGLPLGIPAVPAGVPPPDPNLDPKEDLQRRASAYVQQQIAMMGQPAIKNGSGAGNKRDAAAASGGHVHMSAPGVMGWTGVVGNFNMGGLGGQGTAAGISGFKKGSGRGRGRRPGQRARHSCDDDPNDETYVPSGRYAREEQLASRNDPAAGPRHSEPSAGGSTATHVYMHAGSSTVDSQQFVRHHSMTPAGDYQYGSHNIHVAHGMQHQQQYYDASHAAAATGHHHIGDGAAESTAAQYQQHHQLAGGLSRTDAGITHWPDANSQCSMQQQHGQSTAVVPRTSADSLCETTTAAMVAAAAKWTSLLGLEDTAVAYEAFRQSGGDFKVSLSCLDELLSGGPGLPGTAFDWNFLGGAAHFCKGSRLSLTGSADAAPGQACNQPHGAAQPLSNGHFATCGQQQYQHQHQADMPPPRAQQGPAAGESQRLVPHPELQTTGPQQGVTAAHQELNRSLPGTNSPCQPLYAGVTGGPSQHTAGAHPMSTQGPAQAAVTDSGRCESPFKAAALQQQPFSPALDNKTRPLGPVAYNSTDTAPSHQHTQCSGGQAFSNIPGSCQQAVVGVSGGKQCEQQPQAWAINSDDLAAQGQPPQQRLPPTFHTVLQALGGAHNSSAAAADSNPGLVVKVEPAQTACCPTTTATYAVPASKAPNIQQAAAAGGPMGLQLHSLPDNLHRHSRASFNLLSPVGNIFADATEGCITLDDAMGSIYQSGHNGHDSSQTRAERRSLRLLLGMLSSTPVESQQDMLGWAEHPGATAVDAATLNAADDLTYMRRSSYGGCLLGISCSSRPAGSSDGRPSLSILPPSGRTSQRGLGASQGVLGLGECHKRPRMSITLTSPAGGLAKRPRVSYAGGVTGRLSSGTAEYDDCLSYWQN